MTKKTLRIVALALVCLLFAGACAPAKKAEPASADKLKVALILPGKADDVSFNQSMYEGMMKIADEYKDQIEVKVVEEVYEVADIEPALMDFASDGYDLIFGHGFQFMEPIIKVAEKYPDTFFALGCGYKTLDNTCVYDVHLQDGGYIMGILAASITETGKIGVIGGGDVAEVFRGHEGFKFAAKKINPAIEIQEVYTGDWTDSAGAKEAAISMYDSGVDIIWHSGDGIGLGTVEAAKVKNQLVLGNIADQSPLAPDNVLSGVIYEWDAVIKGIIDDVLNENFKNRQDKFYWIETGNNGLRYSDFGKLGDKVPQDVKDLMATEFEALKNGEIDMPSFDK